LTCQAPSAGRDDIKHSFGRPPSTASASRPPDGLASKGRPAGRSGHRFQVRLQLYGPHPVPRVNGGARGFVGEDDVWGKETRSWAESRSDWRTSRRPLERPYDLVVEIPPVGAATGPWVYSRSMRGRSPPAPGPILRPPSPARRERELRRPVELDSPTPAAGRSRSGEAASSDAPGRHGWLRHAWS
jgi:hypothetical protein